MELCQFTTAQDMAHIKKKRFNNLTWFVGREGTKAKSVKEAFNFIKTKCDFCSRLQPVFNAIDFCRANTDLQQPQSLELN